MLHLRHRERLLWPHPPRLRDAHPARAQLGQLPVSAAASRRLNVTGLQRSLSDRNRHCVSAICGAGSSWCTWSTRTRRSTRVRCVSARVLKMPPRSEPSRDGSARWKIIFSGLSFFFGPLVQHFNPLVVLHKSSRRKKQRVGSRVFFLFFWYLLISMHLSFKLFLFDVLTLFLCHRPPRRGKSIRSYIPQEMFTGKAVQCALIVPAANNSIW